MISDASQVEGLQDWASRGAVAGTIGRLGLCAGHRVRYAAAAPSSGPAAAYRARLPHALSLKHGLFYLGGVIRAACMTG